MSAQRRNRYLLGFNLVNRLLFLVLACTISFIWVSSGSAQDKAATIRMVRAFEPGETGLANPAGLTFSPRANAFYVVESPAVSRNPPANTEIVKMTPFDGQAGSARIAAAVQDPVNMAFDGLHNRLLILQYPANQVIEVQESPDGDLDPTTLARHDARGFGLQDPQGMVVDPETGDVYILDSGGPRIVRVETGPEGNFEDAVITSIRLEKAGSTGVRGLAFDPATGHLHLVNTLEGKLYEVSPSGQLVASRDLSEFGLGDPRGMVFAPSGDQTDDPARLSLYLAGSGALPGAGRHPAQAGQLDVQTVQGDAVAQSSSQIVELSLTPLVEPAASAFSSSLIQTSNLGAISPPSPDPSGLTYFASRGTLVMCDGEVEETVNGITHFQGVNVWELTRGGSVVSTANISKISPTVVPMSNEPTGVAWNPANGHFYFSDDSARRVFDLNPGPDGKIGTVDDSWTSFDTRPSGNLDPEGITYDSWRDRLFVADGVNMEVYEYTTSGALVGQFDVEIYGVVDPESVEFNPDSGTLFVMSSNRQSRVIIETTTGGALLQTIDISASNSRKAAGLAYAPASNGSESKRFYIVDRGVDNNTDPNIVDGKMYEMTAPSALIPPSATATFTASPTPPSSPTMIATSTATPFVSNTPTSTATFTPTPTGTNTPTPTRTATSTSTNTPTSTVTFTPTPTRTSTPTPIPTSPLPDLIFADGFESGDISAWSSNATDSGDLSVSAAAALVGSYGLQAIIDDNVAIYLTDDTPNAEPRYRVRFYFDPNSISMANGNTHDIFYGYSGTSAIVLRVQFRISKSNYQLRAALVNDGTTWTNTNWIAISDSPHAIELNWQAATSAGANNGGLALWLDGLQRSNLAGVDNDTRRIDRVRLGPGAGIDKGTRGTYYFDAFESRRRTYIGP